MSEITIRSKNSRDITPDEVERLAKLVREGLPEHDVKVAGQEEQREGAYGVTWFQIVVIAVSGAGAIIGKELLQELTKASVDWARSRLSKKPSKRPIYIPIYGPDGKILKSVVVKDATSEPEDRTQQDQDFQNGYKK